LAYNQSETPVIAGMNLLIPAGQRVGMMGRTGSGKSTVIRALSGLLHGPLVFNNQVFCSKVHDVDTSRPHTVGREA